MRSFATAMALGFRGSVAGRRVAGYRRDRSPRRGIAVGAMSPRVGAVRVAGRPRIRAGRPCLAAAVIGIGALIAACMLLGLPVVAAAQAPRPDAPPSNDYGSWVVAHRLPLPLDGRALDLSARWPDESAATRSRASGGARATPDAVVAIAITGTLSYAIDGSEIDAMARRSGGTRFEADGPFVRLPAGARLVASDPDAHRYVFELDADGDRDLRLLTSRLAAHSLVPLSEAANALSGRLDVEVLKPSMAAAANGPGSLGNPRSQPRDGATLRPSGFPVHALLSGGSLGGGSLSGGLLVVSSFVALIALGMLRRFRPEQRLVARARRAHRAVGDEAAHLGPAYDGVVAASGRLMEAVSTTIERIGSASDTLSRTAWVVSSAARCRRVALRQERLAEVARLATLTDRLEELATELASLRVGRARAADLEGLLGDLGEHIDVAVGADREANAV